MVSSDLRRFSVLVLIVVTCITCGVAYPIWYLVQRKGLNNLNTMVELKPAPLVFALAASVVALLMGAVAEDGSALDLTMSLLNLIVGIVLVMQAFRVRDMFHRHFANERREAAPTLIRPHLSGAATFFFGPWYLQYRVNRLLDMHTPGVTVVVEDE
jgi:hypothetical protein